MFKVTRSHGTRDVCVENYKIGTYLDKQKIKKYIAGVTVSQQEIRMQDTSINQSWKKEEDVSPLQRKSNKLELGRQKIEDQTSETQ